MEGNRRVRGMKSEGKKRRRKNKTKRNNAAEN